MKFDCGETVSEKASRLSVWHRWFAWRPVQVTSHDCRWLAWIERKGTWDYGLDSEWIWEYRA